MTSKLKNAEVICKWDTIMGRWTVMAVVAFDDSTSKTTDDNYEAAHEIADSFKTVLESYQQGE